MSQTNWDDVKKIFHEALKCPAEEWEAFLEKACGGDEDLRAEVSSLLEADEDSLPWLDSPVFEAAAEALNEDTKVLSGLTIGPYQIIKRLGQGGMGTVYLAERIKEYEDRVAIKLIRPDMIEEGLVEEDLVDRFRQERQILAKLKHPSIADVKDGGMTEDGFPYFIMEYVEGLPIDEYCNNNQLSLEGRIDLFRQVCAAVDYAHRHLVLHCDLKPSNILVTKEGVPKLLDFGIARLMGTQHVPKVTQSAPTTRTGKSQGLTPGYASPEQVRSERLRATSELADDEGLTTTSDVYSLGVLLYKMLTGLLPFRLHSKSLDEIEQIISTQKPPHPSFIVTDQKASASKCWHESPQKLSRLLSGDLDSIILMALRKDPSQRYSSVEQFSEDLRRYLVDLPVLARKGAKSYRVRKFVQRHRVWVSAAALAVISLVVGITVATRAALIAGTERQAAEKVLEFLESLFEGADPYEQGGKDLKVRELLDDAKVQIKTNKELDGQDEMKARMMTTIGIAYRHLDLLDESADLLESAQQLRGSGPGRHSAQFAETLRGLCALRREQGRYDKAKEFCEQALEIQLYDPGKETKAYAKTLMFLALAVRLNGDLGEAELIYDDALKLFRKLRDGEVNRDYAVTLHNLGALLLARGKLAEAEEKTRDAVAIYDVIFAGKNPRLADGWNTLGVILKNQERFDEAEVFLVKALQMRRELLEKGSSKVLTSLVNLGSLYQAQDDYPTAESQYREALELAQEYREPDHPEVANLLHGLGWIRHHVGDEIEAEELIRRAVQIRRGTNPRSLRFASGLIDLGQVLLRQDRNAEAAVNLREGLEIRREKISDTHWKTANAQSLLGESLTAQEHFAEAESLLLESHKVLATSPGAPLEFVRKDLDRLVALYKQWNRPDRAKEFVRKRDLLDASE